MPALSVRQSEPNIRAQFIEGMSRAAFCVNVVTTDGPAGRAGVTISAMSSVSADGGNPTVLVCINQQSRTAAAILENRTFCINVLRDDHADIADRFGGRVNREDGDRFAGASWVEGGTRAPRLANAVVTIINAEDYGRVVRAGRYASRVHRRGGIGHNRIGHGAGLCRSGLRQDRANSAPRRSKATIRRIDD